MYPRCEILCLHNGLRRQRRQRGRLQHIHQVRKARRTIRKRTMVTAQEKQLSGAGIISHVMQHRNRLTVWGFNLESEHVIERLCVLEKVPAGTDWCAGQFNLGQSLCTYSAALHSRDHEAAGQGRINASQRIT